MTRDCEYFVDVRRVYLSLKARGVYPRAISPDTIQGRSCIPFVTFQLHLSGLSDNLSESCQGLIRRGGHGALDYLSESCQGLTHQGGMDPYTSHVALAWL